MATEELRKGHSNDEEYFYRANRELIERKRRELDSDRENLPVKAKTRHWMKCPKCGAEMSEIELSGFKVDKCTACRAA